MMLDHAAQDALLAKAEAFIKDIIATDIIQRRITIGEVYNVVLKEVDSVFRDNSLTLSPLEICRKAIRSCMPLCVSVEDSFRGFSTTTCVLNTLDDISLQEHHCFFRQGTTHHVCFTSTVDAVMFKLNMQMPKD